MYETRQLSKFLRLRRNKTDAGDAIGIAEVGRLGPSLVSKVPLKTLECQALQSRLTIRRFLIRERVATVNLLCRQIELYGGRVRRSTRSLQFRNVLEAEFRKLFGKQHNPLIPELRELLARCEQLLAWQNKIDGTLRQLAHDNEICRRFMEIPGVGPISALTFYATIGDPHRFRRSASVGSYFGLAPRICQSGLTVRPAHITRMGNKATRTLLVQCALKFMQSSSAHCQLRQWALGIERRSGRGQARVALARKLAIIMVAMWKKNECYAARIYEDPADVGCGGMGSEASGKAAAHSLEEPDPAGIQLG
jgi:transposase